MKARLVITLLAASLAVHAQQGIRGQVFLARDEEQVLPRSPQSGVPRELYIYEETLIADAQQSNGIFSQITTRLVETVESRRDGTFRVKLPPGTYSVFVREGEGLYANAIDAGGCINCAMVVARKFTWMPIVIEETNP